MPQIKVLLADDHTIVRNGIKTLLSGFDDLEIIGEASNGLEAIEMVKAFSPEILLIDIAMPRMTGLQAADVISKKYAATRSLILSMHDNDDYILKAVEVGAYGYLLKDTSKEELYNAILAVARGEKYFNSAVSSPIINGYLQNISKDKSPRQKPILSIKERSVIKLIVQGLNSRQVAELLNLSIRTVENHRANMMKKLKVKNAAEMVKMAVEKKLV